MTDALENISLQNYHTFCTDAQAKWLATFNSIETCEEIIKSNLWKNNQTLVLGEGSNTLFSDNFPGLVLVNNIPGIDIIDDKPDHQILKAGGGIIWNDLVNYCVKNNLCGIENLALIPGTVGAAPIQNIGAYGAELADVFVELNAVSTTDGSAKVFSKDDCKFNYRDSIFKNTLKNKFIICDVTLKLSKKINLNLEYDRIKSTLDEMNITTPSLEDVKTAVIKIRNSKLPNPKSIPNAGSFFKNPIIDVEHFEKLKKAFSDLPHYTLKNDQFKIPAAWLIEQCGWKGKMLNQNVGVYENHSLVLINPGKASGNEVLELANIIHHDVFEKFRIDLEPEINII